MRTLATCLALLLPSLAIADEIEFPPDYAPQAKRVKKTKAKPKLAPAKDEVAGEPVTTPKQVDAKPIGPQPIVKPEKPVEKPIEKSMPYGASVDVTAPATKHVATADDEKPSALPATKRTAAADSAEGPTSVTA